MRDYGCVVRQGGLVSLGAAEAALGVLGHIAKLPIVSLGMQ